MCPTEEKDLRITTQILSYNIYLYTLQNYSMLGTQFTPGVTLADTKELWQSRNASLATGGACAPPVGVARLRDVQLS